MAEEPQLLFQEARQRRRRRWLISGLVALVLLAALGVTIGIAAGHVGLRPSSSLSPSEATAPGPHPSGTDYAWVSNTRGLVPFNLINHSTGRTIPFTSQTLTIAPDGKMAYGIDRRGIVPLNLSTGTVGPVISSKMRGWQSIALDAANDTLYVAGGGAFNSIVPVDIKTGAVGRPIPVPGIPVAVNVSPDGRTAYVTTQGGAALTSINLATGATGAVIPVPDGVGSLAISSDGSVAYAVGTLNQGTGTQTSSFVTPIDLATGTTETPIALLHAPQGIVLSQDEQTAYVTDGTSPPGAIGSPTPADVTAIDLASGRVTGTFTIPGGAANIANATS